MFRNLNFLALRFALWIFKIIFSFRLAFQFRRRNHIRNKLTIRVNFDLSFAFSYRRWSTISMLIRCNCIDPLFLIFFFLLSLFTFLLFGSLLDHFSLFQNLFLILLLWTLFLRSFNLPFLWNLAFFAKWSLFWRPRIHLTFVNLTIAVWKLIVFYTFALVIDWF